jgi:cell division septum initiation protein DivIVA
VSDTSSEPGTAEETEQGPWPLTPAAVHGIRFNRASRLRPGYVDEEVDAFRGRVELELQHLTAEKAELRDQVRALRESLERAVAEGAQAPAPAPEEIPVQAVHILSAAQQTADQYVAEAEDFSRRLAGEAREHYEQVVQQARAEADTVLREAATLAAVAREAGPGPAQQTQDVQEEVAYLKAFGQACRTQLRSYLEALLDDVEQEWGRADPRAVARAPRTVADERTPGRTANGTANGTPNGTSTATPNGTGEVDQDVQAVPAVGGGAVIDVRG